jgi:hypothetical protein
MLKELQDKSQQYIDFTLHLILKFRKLFVSLFNCKGGKVGMLMKARFIQQLMHNIHSLAPEEINRCSF